MSGYCGKTTIVFVEQGNSRSSPLLKTVLTSS